jgi:hypothetical protein
LGKKLFGGEMTNFSGCLEKDSFSCKLGRVKNNIPYLEDRECLKEN